MFWPGRGYGRSALRNWVFQVSKDGQNWTTLYTHVDDSSLNEPGYRTHQHTHQALACHGQKPVKQVHSAAPLREPQAADVLKKGLKIQLVENHAVIV